MQDIDRITGLALQALADHMDDIDKYAPAMIRRGITAQLQRRPGLVRDAHLSSDAQRLIRAVTEDAVEEYLLHRSVA